jgi:hypothetical protein
MPFGARSAAGAYVPKQNRPLVRDGRIQAKKRTDRSYLRPSGTPASAEPSSEEIDEAFGEPDEVAEVIETATADVPPARLPPAARAIQQQGMRKRREIDLEALAKADTTYALHEMRRIAVLTAMVLVTLIVLGIVLR